MRKVVLAVVGSRGQVSLNFAAALNRTSQLAEAQNVFIHFDFVDELTSGLSTSAQKNALANRVLSSPSVDGIFFVHPNLSWVPDDFLKLANFNGEGIIAGSFVDSFDMAESYAVTLKDAYDSEGTKEYPLAAYVTTGFLYVPKKVLQGLTQFVECLGEEGDEDKFYLFFKETIKDGLLLQEDSYFCDMVQSSGFDIFIDPTINCTNNSIVSVRTNYQEYLSKRWIAKMGEESADITEN